jgi:CheY-like chemotaxis protein
MGLQCLAVTSDFRLIGQIKTILNEHGVSLDLRQDSVSAMELISRRHWDGVVIDCDNVPGATEAIADIRKSRSNKQTLIFAVIDGLTSVETALDLGANFVLSKPLQQTRWRSVVEAVIPKMQREHRRYFRHEVDLPVRLVGHDGKTLSARLKNISEGGMAIKLTDPLRLEGVMNLEFEIPSVESKTFRAKTDVVWSDAFVSGMRFLYVEKESASALQEWLDFLEAQLQFRDSCADTK